MHKVIKNGPHFECPWRNCIFHADEIKFGLCFRPDLLDFNRLDPADHIGNLNHAFDVADQQLGIPKILDAEGNFTKI